MEALVVGVDAGGSRTVVAVARGSQLVRTVTGEGANPSVVGSAAAAETIERTIHRALEGERPMAIVVGAAGTARRKTSDELRAALARRFPEARVVVRDDASVTLRAAVPAGDAIVLIAGTGSIAFAEIGGREIRAGGYGYLLGDAGSGFAIGAAVLRSLLYAFDSLEPLDAMLDDVRSRLGASTARDAVGRIYQSATPVSFIAAFAPIVLEHANAGAPNARAIAGDAARSLVELVRAVVPARPSGELPVVLSGGLLREKNVLSELVRSRIADELPSLRVLEKPQEAYVGALVQARALLR